MLCGETRGISTGGVVVVVWVTNPEGAEDDRKSPVSDRHESLTPTTDRKSGCARVWT